jgi:hypothetical protein
MSLLSTSCGAAGDDCAKATWDVVSNSPKGRMKPDVFILLLPDGQI